VGVNPTPGNLWLMDKDATWWITSQGEYKGPDGLGGAFAITYSAVGLGVTGARAPDADRMGERA
jgi:Protein of unknown function (DUF4087)